MHVPTRVRRQACAAMMDELLHHPNPAALLQVRRFFAAAIAAVAESAAAKSGLSDARAGTLAAPPGGVEALPTQSPHELELVQLAQQAAELAGMTPEQVPGLVQLFELVDREARGAAQVETLKGIARRALDTDWKDGQAMHVLDRFQHLIDALTLIMEVT